MRPVNSLLAHLTESQQWRPEPIATEALVHLLGRPEARVALAGWADAFVPGLGAAELEYTGQAVNLVATGRPDVVGSAGTDVRVVIEAKFVAQLTPAQSGGAYLGHLGNTGPGLLVYLVPEDRVATMWSAARKIHEPSHEPPDGPRRLHTPDGHVVTVLPWDYLLDLREKAPGDTTAAADVASCEA